MPTSASARGVVSAVSATRTSARQLDFDPMMGEHLVRSRAQEHAERAGRVERDARAREARVGVGGDDERPPGDERARTWSRLMGSCTGSRCRRRTPGRSRSRRRFPPPRAVALITAYERAVSRSSASGNVTSATSLVAVIFTARPLTRSSFSTLLPINTGSRAQSCMGRMPDRSVRATEHHRRGIDIDAERHERRAAGGLRASPEADGRAEHDERATEPSNRPHGNSTIRNPSESQACHAGSAMSPDAVSTPFTSVLVWVKRPRASSA